MGAWGPAIFSNDTAPEVRDDFRDLVGRGATADEATAKVVEDYCVGDPADPDNNDVWLGLAATQHKTGHTVPSVIERALAITESEEELDRWDPDERKGRLKALLKLRDELQSPVPPPRTIKPRRLAQTVLEPGQHQLFTDGESGSRFLLRVVRIYEDKGGRSPLYTVLDWAGTEAALHAPQNIAPLRKSASRGNTPFFGFLLVGKKPSKANLALLPERYEGPQLEWDQTGLSAMGWSWLDSVVRRDAEIVPPTVRRPEDEQR